MSCVESASCDPLDENSLPSSTVDDNFSKSCNDTSAVLESSYLDRTCAETSSWDPLDESIRTVDDNFSKSCNDTSMVLESSSLDRTWAGPSSCYPLDESSFPSGTGDDNFFKSCNGTSVVLESPGLNGTCTRPSFSNPLDEISLPSGVVDDNLSKSFTGTSVVFKSYGPDRTCAELATSVIFESYDPDRTCAKPASCDPPDESSLASGIADNDFSSSCNGTSVVLQSSSLDRTCAEPSCDPLDESSFSSGITDGNFSESCNDTSVVLESPTLDRTSVKPDFGNWHNERRFRSGLVDDNVSKRRCKDDLVALNNDAEQYDICNPPDESHLPSDVADNNIYNSCMDLSMVLESVGQTEPFLFSSQHAQDLRDKKWKEVIEGVYVEPTLSSEAEILDCLPDCEGYYVETQPESSDNDRQSSTGKQLERIIRRTNSHGTILQNELGENKCLLNVIIQSLWHLRRFRVEFLECPKHQHTLKEPCFVCELHDIFAVMNKVSTKAHTKAADFALSWIALRKTDPNSSLFQLGQMNDAYKVLKSIFNRIHQSFDSFGDCEAKVIDKNCIVLWDSGSYTCISHGLFGMSIYEKSVCESGNESRGSKYIQFFHRIDATLLRELKVTYAMSSFDELLTKMKVALCACAYYGCSKLHHKIKFVFSPPHFYVIVLDWQSTSDTTKDILATLDAITLEIDLGLQYCGVYQGGKRILVSVISFDGQCYISCAYNSEQDKWIKYNGETVEDIGDWNEVCSLLGSLCSRPQVLLFEDPKS